MIEENRKGWAVVFIIIGLISILMSYCQAKEAKEERIRAEKYCREEISKSVRSSAKKTPTHSASKS